MRTDKYEDLMNLASYVQQQLTLAIGEIIDFEIEYQDDKLQEICGEIKKIKDYFSTVESKAEQVWLEIMLRNKQEAASEQGR